MAQCVSEGEAVHLRGDDFVQRDEAEPGDEQREWELLGIAARAEEHEDQLR